MAVPRRRALLALQAIVLVAVALVATACGGGGKAAAPPTAPLAPQFPAKHGGTLHLVTAASSIALDPAFASDPASQRIAFVTCETLLTYADQPGEGGRTLIPGLARELPTVGKDGRSFTFALKAHVHFANGAVVTPDDIKATFERLWTRACTRRARCSSATSRVSRRTARDARRTSRESRRRREA